MASSPAPDSQARRLAVIVKRERLVTLAPGQRWETPLETTTFYAGRPLAPGQYTARVVYTNYPDYDYLHYDPFQMPAGIWEGTLASSAVGFTVAEPEPDDLRRLIERLDSAATDRAVAAQLLAVAGRKASRRCSIGCRLVTSGFIWMSSWPCNIAIRRRSVKRWPLSQPVCLRSAGRFLVHPRFTCSSAGE